MSDDPPRPTTTDAGIPAPSDEHSLSVGPNGPLLLQDHYLIEQMAQFNRERIPERQPHAKGSGAFGRFEVTADVSAFTKAALFQPGTTTDMGARFSTVAGERVGVALAPVTSGGHRKNESGVERLTARQIKAARRALTRHMKRAGRVWIRVFPDVPVSKKPTEVRMGKGKGTPEFWAARVKPGRIMFELDGVPPEVAREAFELAAAKLPIGTRFVTRLGEGAQP